MPRPGSAPQPAYERGDSLAYGQASAANRADLPDFKPSGEEEEFLFGPTDRPTEPLSAGAPFGAGPDVPGLGPEAPEQFLGRVAESLGANPEASPEVRKFVARVAERANRGL